MSIETQREMLNILEKAINEAEISYVKRKCNKSKKKSKDIN